MIAPDSLSYARLGFSDGHLPPDLLLKRPPLYLLMVAPFVRMHWLTGLFLLQSLLTAASCIAVVLAVRRLWPWAANLTAVAVVGNAAFTFVVIHDWALLSESVFASMVRFTVAGLLLWCASRRVEWLAGTAAVAAAACLVRPNGIVLLSLLVPLAMVYSASWRQAAYRAAGVLMIVALPLLAVAAWNAVTVSYPTISIGGTESLMAATQLYWTPSHEYPPEVNDAIAKFQAGAPSGDFSLAQATWNPNQLYAIFLRNYRWMDVYRTFRPLAEKGVIRGDGPAPYVHLVDLYAIVAHDAIRRHPILFTKFTLANFYHLTVVNAGRAINPVHLARLNRERWSNEWAKPFARLQPKTEPNATGVLARTVDRLWPGTQMAAFRSRLIPILAVGLALWSAASLLRGSRTDLEVLCLVTVFGYCTANLLTAAMQPADIRYSYPFEPLAGLTVAVGLARAAMLSAASVVSEAHV